MLSNRTALRLCSRASRPSTSAVAVPARRLQGIRVRAQSNIAANTRQTPSHKTIYTQPAHHARLLSNTARLSQSNSSYEPLSLKEYKFEDINSALPTQDSSSPSSKPNIILIDVREPPELEATGIIPSALSIPIGSQTDAMFLTPDEFLTRFGFPKPGTEGGDDNTTAKMVFYCKAGIRARTAGELAVRAGYDADRIGVYDGSILDWEKNGGRVERWDGPEN
ncbi:TPA_exp: Rhodanese domain protein [Trichophyton benhamiae CBS 112371]|uniref:Rhodanese domain protein n=1 Tax=Arthroderma benhamiae (strain ATCC MYA-4681 / CBS 112371) TaxID=663331 RepID=D4B5Q6_ARTBC|nr:Rhodanese domain protein [Trichophyton benhamiae CBS 112371]EFE29242.1 Rhodanese domain protein [Trichophyton benhamiae CBS 112371]DAA72527.1 TPA_exp: Rhodanese domain protein [Trichophyton benhamiae CBS 112371]